VPKEKVLPPDPSDPAWFTGTHAEHAAIWQKRCGPAELHTECKNAEATHATHLARLVTRATVLAGGEPNMFRIAARFNFCD
jgi:hypothetical protein